MTAGTELWEAHECNKPGHLRQDCSVYKERIAEERNKPEGRERERVETTAVVQAEMVERWEHADRIVSSRVDMRCVLMYRDARGTVVKMVVHLDQLAILVVCLC